MKLGKGSPQVLQGSRALTHRATHRTGEQPPLHSATMPRLHRCLAPILLALSGAAWADTCLIVGVSDGDTLKARCGLSGAYEQVTIRINEIDAPEKGQPFGQTLQSVDNIGRNGLPFRVQNLLR